MKHFRPDADRMRIARGLIGGDPVDEIVRALARHLGEITARMALDLDEPVQVEQTVDERGVAGSLAGWSVILPLQPNHMPF